MDRLLGSVLSGDATEQALGMMRALCEMIVQTADCAVGVVAANTALDSLSEFADEYEATSEAAAAWRTWCRRCLV